jgi:hypothetical protein
MSRTSFASRAPVPSSSSSTSPSSSPSVSGSPTLCVFPLSFFLYAILTLLFFAQWGITFLFLSAIPLCFQTNHGWSEGNTGLAYIPLIIGCFIGFGTSRWADTFYDKKRDANGGVPIPEYRLIGAMAFAWSMPAVCRFSPPRWTGGFWEV